MTVSVDDTAHVDPAIAPAGAGVRVALWSGTVLALVAAGLVLWSARASAVFADMLSAAIAWCF